MVELNDWQRFEEGATLGSEGSELGEVVKDDEHPLGARITLERSTSTAPFAITCGVYGCLVHTRFFATEAAATAEFEKMKAALSDILLNGPDDGESTTAFFQAISAFVTDYP